MLEYQSKISHKNRILAVFILSQVSGTLEAFFYQQDTKGRVLLNSSSVTLSSVSKCAQNCLSEINCKSFGYKNSTQECFWSEFSSYSVSSLASDSYYTVIYDTGKCSKVS